MVAPGVIVIIGDMASIFEPSVTKTLMSLFPILEDINIAGSGSEKESMSASGLSGSSLIQDDKKNNIPANMKRIHFSILNCILPDKDS